MHGKRDALDGEVPEFLADALVEARPRELGEAADVLGKRTASSAPGSRPPVCSVDGDVDRLAAGSVFDVEDVARGDEEARAVSEWGEM